MRLSVECAFPYLDKRGVASRKGAFWIVTLTEKRILGPAATHTASFREVKLQTDLCGPWRNPPPQPGGRLLERICPVEPSFIVPRSLAGGCSPRLPGGDVTERRSLCDLGPQSAPFREGSGPECAFP